MPRRPSHDAPSPDPELGEREGEGGEIGNNLQSSTDLPSDLQGDPEAAGGRKPVDRSEGEGGDRRRDPPSDRRAISSDLELDDRPPSDRNDPSDDEVWFEAESLAAASRVELGAAVDTRASLLRPGPGHEQLQRELTTPGVGLGRLPGWPDAGEAGQGWGPQLDALVGALQPGDLLLLTARVRGAGRTSLLAQLADGLALRELSGAEGPATPVLVCVDEAPERWRARSFARWSGVDLHGLTGAGPGDRRTLAEALRRFAAGSWSRLEQRQRFAELELLREAAGRRELLAELRRWRAELAEDRGRDASDLWPVLIVDPLEQLGPADAALAGLAAIAAEEGLLILAAADEPEAGDLAASRAVDRHLAARLRLEPVEAGPAEGELRSLAVELAHRRLGPRGRVTLSWSPSCGRFAAVEVDR